MAVYIEATAAQIKCTQPACVLVIEADPDLRVLLVDLLADEGYDVVAARDEADGLRALRQHRPDAILLDLGRHTGQGLELLERLRSGERAGSIPVVAITAGPTEAVARREAGLHGVVRKPFDIDLMLQLLACVTDTAGGRRPGDQAG